MAQLQLPTIVCEELLNDVIHPVAEIQQAGAQALAALLKRETGLIDRVLEQLLAIYHEKLAVRNMTVLTCSCAFSCFEMVKGIMYTFCN